MGRSGETWPRRFWHDPDFPVRQTLITLLSDGQFHSGEQLERLGSWRRVSKTYGRAWAIGLDLFSLTGKGYRWRCPWPL